MVYGERVLTGGVLPLFTSWALLRENGSSESVRVKDCSANLLEAYTVEDVKEFLWKLGFIEYNEYVFTFIASRILKSSQIFRLKLRDEYKSYVQPDQNEEAFRAQLSYYINKNYDRVHDNIISLCGFPKTAFFNTVKSFIETLGSVFIVHGKNV